MSVPPCVIAGFVAVKVVLSMSFGYGRDEVFRGCVLTVMFYLLILRVPMLLAERISKRIRMRPIAMHEAAHALLIEILGVARVSRVTFAPDGDSMARVSCTDFDEGVTDSSRKIAMLYLAGFVVCKMYGFKFAILGCDSDLEKVSSYIRSRVLGACEPYRRCEMERLYEELFAETWKVLELHKGRLSLLYDAMVACKEMSGETVRQIIG